jgi:predicted metalloprotease
MRWRGLRRSDNVRDERGMDGAGGGGREGTPSTATDGTSQFVREILGGTGEVCGSVTGAAGPFACAGNQRVHLDTSPSQTRRLLEPAACGTFR